MGNPTYRPFDPVSTMMSLPLMSLFVRKGHVVSFRNASRVCGVMRVGYSGNFIPHYFNLNHTAAPADRWDTITPGSSPDTALVGVAQDRWCVFAAIDDSSQFTVYVLDADDPSVAPQTVSIIVHFAVDLTDDGAIARATLDVPGGAADVFVVHGTITGMAMYQVCKIDASTGTPSCRSNSFNPGHVDGMVAVGTGSEE